MHRKQTTCRTRGKSSGISRRPTKVSPSISSTPIPPTDKELLEAVIRGDCEVVTTLLKKGGNVHAAGHQCSDGSTLLTRTAELGNLPMIQLLVAHGANINHKKNGGGTALTAVAKIGHLAAVKYLISQGANVNTTSPRTEPAAVAEAIMQGHLEVVKYLIECKADINSIYCGNQTVLMMAAHKGHLAIVKLLTASGANVRTAVGPNRTTAMSLAISGGNLAMIEHLAACGADVHAPRNMIAASHSASANGIRFLMGRGVNPNTTSADGTSLLCSPAHFCRLEVIKCFVTHGANIHGKNDKGQTPLITATERVNPGVFTVANRLAMLKYLLSCGSKIDERDNDGNTALHIASLNGYYELAECLINHGANFRATNNKGEAAAALARNKKHTRLAQYLSDVCAGHIKPVIVVHHHTFSPRAVTMPSAAGSSISGPSLWTTPKSLPPTPKPLPSLPIGNAIARYPYVATSSGEISFSQGEKLLIIEKQTGGWWRCQSKTSAGLAPSNYLLEETPLPSPALAPSPFSR